MADSGGPVPREPKASRPQMSGYGVPESLEGALPWEWARERLSKSHNYWLTSVRPNGAPHTMVIWGIWLDGAFYLSTGATTRKARNLQQNPNCIVCNENAEEAVILEGIARKLDDDKIPQQAFADYKAKYGWELDPKMGPVFEVRPRAVFAMPEKQFPKGGHALEVRVSPTVAGQYLRSIDIGETHLQPMPFTMLQGFPGPIGGSSIERKLSMSKEAAHHHAQAAEHHEHAARHHREAASHHESGDHEKAAHHAHVAHGHHAHAIHHATEAAKAHTEAHGTE